MSAARSTAARWGRAGGRLVLHLVVLVLMVSWFTPLLALFVASFRTENDTARTGWWMAFVQPLFTTYNFERAIDIMSIGDSIGTSLAISIPVTILTTLLSAVGAYALTRMRFRGRTAISLLLVGLLVAPPQVTLVPMLRFFNLTGLSGTVPAIWIFQVGFTLPFGIFLVRGFIAAIPTDLFEAASIDGAGHLRTFRSVVLPVSLPILASLAIMQFLWSWNDLLVPLLFLGGSDLAAPMTVQVAGLQQSTGQGLSQVLAATCISIIIPLALIVGLQRYFVRGVLGGAVKG